MVIHLAKRTRGGKGGFFPFPTSALNSICFSLVLRILVHCFGFLSVLEILKLRRLNVGHLNSKGESQHFSLRRLLYEGKLGQLVLVGHCKSSVGGEAQ